MATPTPIFQNVVNILPSIGIKGYTYYVPNGNGSDLSEYLADSIGHLRFIGTRPVTFINSLKTKNILGETISGGSLVYLNSVNNRLFKYNQSDLNLYNKALGFTNNAGVLDQEVDIIVSGECNQFGGLITGDQYFASNNGLITNTPPNLNIFQPIGVAKNATILIINIQRPFIKI